MATSATLMNHAIECVALIDAFAPRSCRRVELVKHKGKPRPQFIRAPPNHGQRIGSMMSLGHPGTSFRSSMTRSFIGYPEGFEIVSKLWSNSDGMLRIRIASILDRTSESVSLSLTTPGNTRRIVSENRLVRFFDTTTDRELASILVDGEVKDIQMTDDGTRLIVSLADGSARVWDIRDPEERRKDFQRRWAERVPAGEYLDPLMAGPTPTGELLAIIKADDSLTPLRRLAAAEVLDECLAEIEYQADRAFKAITKDQTDKALVLVSAEASDLPVRIKEHVLAKAEAWASAQPRNSEEEEPSEAPKQ